MNRPTRERGAAVWRRSFSLAVALSILSACSHRAEQRALQNFFDASRLGDNVALAGMATVRFDPTSDGVVRTFTITSVESEDPNPVTNDERTARIAALSLATAGEAAGVAASPGELLSESVKMRAPVEVENGQTVQKMITVVLARARLQEAGSTGRWIVTGFTVYGLADSGFQSPGSRPKDR
jgi:hypothetical protein